MVSFLFAFVLAALALTFLTGAGYFSVRQQVGWMESSRRFERRKPVMKPEKAVAKAGSTQNPAKKDSSQKGPTPEEIRERAFQIYIERGGIHGCDLDDWLQAEHELQEKFKEE